MDMNGGVVFYNDVTQQPTDSNLLKVTPNHWTMKG